MTAASRDTSGREAEDVVRIGILDYGMGNLRSVEKALERVGAGVTITAEPEVAAQADGIVLPGVGAFPKAMARIEQLQFDRLIGERLAAGVPVLGICLGFQLIFDSSAEGGGCAGLGLIGGEVEALHAPGLKLPHIGWEPMRVTGSSELVEGIEDETPFYFVHGFAPRPADEAAVVGTATHGETFACAIARPPLYGVQFHPEKSSAAGMRLLQNFTGICAKVPEASRLNSGGSRLRPAGSASQ